MSKEDKIKRKGVDALQSLVKGPETGIAALAIRSAYFGTYLCMDGSNLDEGGAGKVYSHSHAGLWEMFRLVPQSDGTSAIQSLQFDTWLRMDANGVDSEPGGVVNCQSYVGDLEKFNILPQDDGSVAIQSVRFGTYLRMESIGVSLQPRGGGTVNCSKELRSWEKFYINVIPPVFGIRSQAYKFYLRMDCHQGSKVSAQTYFGQWQKFELTWQEDGTVGLKSVAFKQYLSAQTDGSAGCAPFMGHREKFIPVFLSDGTITFKTTTTENSLYLSISRNAEVSFQNKLGNEERFEVMVDLQ
jgi:hypothetical protein